MSYTVIIPAAGRGTRMGADENKLFLPLLDKPIIAYTLQVFEGDKACDGIVLVVKDEERDRFQEICTTYGIQKVTQYVAGGNERQDSVMKGVRAIQNTSSLVFVHDGARPFVRRKTLEELAEKATNSGGAIVAVPVKDTVKKVHDNRVTETIDRASLWAVQTPQAFQIGVLLRAYEWAVEHNFLGTDEASVVEQLGVDVCVVEGDYENVKMTTQEDLIYGAAILAKRQEQESKEKG